MKISLADLDDNRTFRLKSDAFWDEITKYNRFCKLCQSAATPSSLIPSASAMTYICHFYIFIIYIYIYIYIYKISTTMNVGL